MPLDHIRAAVGFLDMLCHGITKMGSVNSQESTWDLPDYDSLRVRNRAGSTLYILNKKMHKKWAKAVQVQVPEWTRLGVFKIRPIGPAVECIFTILVVIVAGGATFYQAFGILGIAATAILAIVGITSYFAFRRYRGQEPDQPLPSDAYQRESCKALQIILEAARKQCTSKFRVYVIGKYDELSYTGKNIETSNGHILHQAFLEP
jgi:hypothetical protein